MSHKRTTSYRQTGTAPRGSHARGAHVSPVSVGSASPHSKKPFVIAIVVGLLATVIIALLLQNVFWGSNPHLVENGQKVTVEIAEGSSTQAIAKKLYDEGLITSEGSFKNEVSAQNAASDLKPGTYVMVGGMSDYDLVMMLVAGPGVGENPLIVPEGYTVDRTAAAVEQAYKGAITADAFRAECKNAAAYQDDFPFVKGAYNNSLEGFLFPKTYEVVDGYSASDVVRQMLKQYQEETATLDYSYAQSKGLSQYQALVLASIVEREAAHDNKPTVASVFYNRLGIDMALQSDATTAYAVGHDPTPDDLKVEGPFNSYLNKGLVPGPICSPGLDSLRAVCNPDSTEYLYFYFKNNGKGGLDYFFSKTYEEHQAAINS